MLAACLPDCWTVSGAAIKRQECANLTGIDVLESAIHRVYNSARHVAKLELQTADKPGNVRERICMIRWTIWMRRDGQSVCEEEGEI